MKSLVVEDAMRQVWNSHWDAVATQMEEDVTALSAISVMKKLVEFLRLICLEGFKAWLQQADSREDVIQREGETLRDKLTSAKEFATPCGTFTLSRRLYQADRGGSTHAPVDEAWGMVGEFATPEIRELAAFYHYSALFDFIRDGIEGFSGVRCLRIRVVGRGVSPG